MPQPFDAVLVIAFGGPQGPDDVRPFLANVLRGRRVAPGRVDEVARHYELFGGVSPITELTRKQAAGLRERLLQDGPDLPVYVGMRNWHPYLEETLRGMAADGIRRAIGFIMAAHRSYSSCTQYRENVRDARAVLARSGIAPADVIFVDDWHVHAGFVEASAQHIEAARLTLPDAVRRRARLVFTAHSIPSSMAGQYPYREQLLESARLIAARVDTSDWTLVYQSRSGRPEDPWLEPDVCGYLREHAGRDLEAAILAPIGFVADHIEVLYDLDREAAEVCRDAGLPFARAAAVNDNPAFLDMMADVVRATWARYEGGRPLALAVAQAGARS